MALKEKSSGAYNFAIIKKKFDNFGSENILNEFGHILCKVKIPFFNPYKNLQVQDLNNSNIVFIQEKNSMFYKRKILRDRSNKFIAKITKNKILFTSKMFIKGSNKNTSFKVLGDLKQGTYKIFFASNSEILVKVKMMTIMNNLSKKLQINSANYYSIEFFNQNIEKLTIISYVISINSLVYKLHRISDIAGFERRIARLRPFGPGKTLN